MKVFRKKPPKLSYVANGDLKGIASFSELADNICLGATEEKEKKIYLITSALPGEGKTTIATNLAISLAKRGRKILLIDANLRNPAIDKIFNVINSPGLTELVCNGLSLEGIIHEIAEYNIHMISSGKIDHEPFEVLTSKLLPPFLEKAKEIYDFVILDCTAVNSYVDPLLLSPLVDWVIMVILADKTEKNKAIIAKYKIAHAEGKILGVVLNRADLPRL